MQQGIIVTALAVVPLLTCAPSWASPRGSQDNPVNVIIDQSAGPLAVESTAALPAGVTRQGVALKDHVQFTLFGGEDKTVLTPPRITADGDGERLTVEPGRCLAITEITVTVENSLPRPIIFHMGLTSESGGVFARRKLVGVPNADGLAEIVRSFPDGIILKLDPDQPQFNRFGVVRPSRVIVAGVGGSGYYFDCPD